MQTMFMLVKSLNIDIHIVQSLGITSLISVTFQLVLFGAQV